jgi:hypothetical protein
VKNDLLWLVSLPSKYLHFIRGAHVEYYFMSDNKFHTRVDSALQIWSVLKAFFGVVLAAFFFILILASTGNVLAPLTDTGGSVFWLATVNVIIFPFALLLVAGFDYGISLVTTRFCPLSLLLFCVNPHPTEPEGYVRRGDRKTKLAQFGYASRDIIILLMIVTYYESMLVELVRHGVSHIIFKELLGLFSSFSILPVLIFLLKGKLLGNLMIYVRRTAVNRGILVSFRANKTITAGGKVTSFHKQNYYIHTLRAKRWVN